MFDMTHLTGWLLRVGPAGVCVCVCVCVWLLGVGRAGVCVCVRERETETERKFHSTAMTHLYV